MGRVRGAFGVRGWVRVESYTDPAENILAYSPWLLQREGGWQAMDVVDGRAHARGVVAHLAGCEGRDAALALVGAEIAVRRSQLPPAEPGEYYWSDLVGLRVSTREGVDLGRIERMVETGANDVMVVRGERERWIPFLAGEVVLEVNLEQGWMRVDWDPDF